MYHKENIKLIFGKKNIYIYMFSSPKSPCLGGFWLGGGSKTYSKDSSFRNPNSLGQHNACWSLAWVVVTIPWQGSSVPGHCRSSTERGNQISWILMFGGAYCGALSSIVVLSVVLVLLLFESCDGICWEKKYVILVE